MKFAKLSFNWKNGVVQVLIGKIGRPMMKENKNVTLLAFFPTNLWEEFVGPLVVLPKEIFFQISDRHALNAYVFHARLFFSMQKCAFRLKFWAYFPNKLKWANLQWICLGNNGSTVEECAKYWWPRNVLVLLNF